jgi:hypothetical protein
MNPISWHTRALDRLADFYVAADPRERDEITATAESVNRGLQDDPATQGESRGGRSRVTFYGRMTVYFVPAEAGRPTRVLMVHWTTPRRR